MNILLALLIAVTPVNPCEGPPSEACENALANAALDWEKEYHMSRAREIMLIQLTSEAAQPAKIDRSDAVWASIVGLGFGALGGVLITAYVLR